MIKDVKVRRHWATGKFYAVCLSTEFGHCTQWGLTALEALKKLQEYVTRHWSEQWPE